MRWVRKVEATAAGTPAARAGRRFRAWRALVACVLALASHPALAQRAPARPAVPVLAPYDPALGGVPLDPAWPKTLLVFADSVVLDTKTALRKALPDWEISFAGRPSLMLVNSLDIIRKRKEPMASVVVIGLGYNTLWNRQQPGPSAEKFDKAADELLALLKEKGARKVVWVLLRELTPEMVKSGVITSKNLGDYRHYVAVNERLRALKARHPDLALADWATPGRAAGLTIDAVHLNARGLELMVEVIKPAIGVGEAPAAAPAQGAPPEAPAPAPGSTPAPQPELVLEPLPPPPPAAELRPREPGPAAAQAPPAATPNPGFAFRDCAACPEMMLVPAGRFRMGAPAGEPDAREEEQPQREVAIARPLAVGKFEVTFAEWAACVEGGGCTENAAPDDEGWGRGRRPVINVSWEDAQAFVRWLSQKTGKAYRLLTEAEWEYAARAGSMTAYAAGATLDTGQANFNDSAGGEVPAGSDRYRERTVEVGQFAPNAFGLHDMHGNVWEWVQDVWTESLASAPSDGSAQAKGDEGERVIRGGSWYRQAQYARSASRHNDITSTRSNEVGFRVARDL